MQMLALTVGLDEVGRGALAGELVVGAVSLNGINKRQLVEELERILRRRLADSKKLSPGQRERAAAYLREQVIWDIGEAEVEEIDRLGLTEATKLAAGRAMDGIRKQGYVIERVVADAGLLHPYQASIPTKHFVRGDEKILEITCASIIAKVYRDTVMRELALLVPQYGWKRNVGYGSEQHMRMIAEHGPHERHRKSFLKK